MTIFLNGLKDQDDEVLRTNVSMEPQMAFEKAVSRARDFAMYKGLDVTLTGKCFSCTATCRETAQPVIEEERGENSVAKTQQSAITSPERVPVDGGRNANLSTSVMV